MLTSTLISMFGWMSVRRIFIKLFEKKIVSVENFFGIDVFILSLSTLPLFFQWNRVFCCLYFLFLMFLASLVPFWVELRRKSEFNESLVSAMDAILLSLKSGKSFRDSLGEISTAEAQYGFYLKEIASLILLRQTFSIKNSDPKIQRVYFELKMADQSTHRIADRIKSFRYQLKVEENFRQKSRMATLQARAQSIIVGILYFLALIFDFVNFSKNLDFKFIGISFLLFIFGTFWIWNLGRSHQWKV